MVYRFLFICSCILSSSTLNAQYTVTQIDSICNSIDSGKNHCSIACGNIASRENCYSTRSNEILLSCSGFTLVRDTNFLYKYHYLNNKPIKATLSLQYPVNNNIYSATYYFDGDKTIKVIGEDTDLSNRELAFSYAKAHSYWFPKILSKSGR